MNERRAIGRFSLRRRIGGAALLIAAMAVLTLAYLFAFGEYPRDSDQANAFLQAQDMAAGDLLLRGWWLTASTFWTSETPLQALMITLLGPRPIIMLITPALIWAAIVLGSLLLVLCRDRLTVGGVLLVLVALGLPMIRDNDPMQLISRSPIHVSTTLQLLLIFVLAAHSLERGSIRYALACALVLAVSVPSDPLILVIGVPTVVLVGFQLAFLAFGWQRVLFVFLMLVGAVAGGAVLPAVAALGGFNTFKAPLGFVSLDRLGLNFQLGLQSILLLSGTNIFGKSLWDALPYLVRLPVLAVVVKVLIDMSLRIAKTDSGAEEPRPLDRLLCVAVLVNVAAALFSDLLKDVWSARYFLPAFVFSVILAGRNLPRSAILAVLLALSFVASLGWTAMRYSRDIPRVAVFKQEELDLARWLTAHRLSRGYASYWSASVVTAASGGMVGVRPVEAGPTGIAPRLWLANETWFEGFGQQRPFFVLSDKGTVEFGISEAETRARFGPPTRRVEFERHVVSIFD